MAVSFGAGTVVFLIVVLVAAVYYNRHKVVRRRPAQRQQQQQQPHMNPLQEITDIMGGVPFHMPVEALLRQPPPRYTSQQDLRSIVTSQINRAFVNDDDLPPPMYSSKVDLTDQSVISVRERPPLYRSHQSLVSVETLNRQNMLEAEQTRETYVDGARSLNASFEEPEALPDARRARTLNDYRSRRRRTCGRVGHRRRTSTMFSLVQALKRRVSQVQPSSQASDTSDRPAEQQQQQTTNSAEGDNEAQFFHVTPRALVRQYERAARNQRREEPVSPWNGSAVEPEVATSGVTEMPVNPNARNATKRKRRVNRQYRNLSARLTEIACTNDTAATGSHGASVTEVTCTNDTAAAGSHGAGATESPFAPVRFHPLDRRGWQQFTADSSRAAPEDVTAAQAAGSLPQTHACINETRRASGSASQTHRKRANTVSHCTQTNGHADFSSGQAARVTNDANDMITEHRRLSNNADDVALHRHVRPEQAMKELSAGELLQDFADIWHNRHNQHMTSSSSSSSPEALDATARTQQRTARQ